ncbi:MAG: elongation factor G [Anaerolineales bacterium]|nr:elongation factor G [Anaerolineales bacterium]
MKEYGTSKLRNVALISHGGGGKTSLSEALLFATGVITRMGKVDDGSSVGDFEDEEIRRTLSLSTAMIPLEFKDQKINILDTPGYTDFIGEVISALRVADSAIVLVDSVAGVEVGTEIVWEQANVFHLPRFVLISKMDRDNASFERVLASIETLDPDVTFIPIQLPWGENQDFKGVIDLFSMKARPADGSKMEPIPADLQEAAEEARMVLVEAAAESDDALIEKYLEGEELSAEEIAHGFKLAVKNGSFVPVLVSAGTAGIGSIPLLESILFLLPSPEDSSSFNLSGAGDAEEEGTISDAGKLAAYVWKTTADPFVGKLTYFRVYSGVLDGDSKVYNINKDTEERMGSLYTLRGKEQLTVDVLHAGDLGVVAKLSETATGDTLGDKSLKATLPLPVYPNALFSVAVHPRTQADSTKMGSALTRLCEEDPTLSWHNEPATRQTILQGMGDQHIDVAIRKAESKFQVGLETEIPKVPYKETITRAGQSQYRHKKQTGGAGQFGEVHLRVEPIKDEEEDFIFKNEVFGGAVSQGYMPAIEKGVRSVMRDGVMAGYPIEKVLVAVIDGKEHPVDSKAVAFEIAGREAFKLAFHEAGPVFLEPIMHLRVIVPEANMGDILGDLNTRRARVQGMETERGHSVVTADVPLAEIQRYTTDMRSMTGGRGMFSMKLKSYEVVPTHVAEQIIQAARKEKDNSEND